MWKRFWWLRKAGVFEAFFETLGGLSGTAHLVQMFDSTVVRAHVMRCEKAAKSFASIVSLALCFIILKFIHMA